MDLTRQLLVTYEMREKLEAVDVACSSKPETSSPPLIPDSHGESIFSDSGGRNLGSEAGG